MKGLFPLDISYLGFTECLLTYKDFLNKCLFQKVKLLTKKSSKLIVNETYKSVNIFGFASHVVSVITIVHLYKYSVKAAMGHT